MLPKVARVAWLYDFYGKLLTDKQQKIIELYYNQDLSLGEIAEEYSISRQAVHDLIRRAETTLEEYESKLGVLQKYLTEKELLQKAIDLIEKGEQDRNSLKQAKELLSELLGSN
ncbi:putative DNA-binding protein [Bacillota bacterium LX-D]|nr:putative DNA-binding protein [Bacillota bacterium LX-D]